jgi:hypothetical protein
VTLEERAKEASEYSRRQLRQLFGDDVDTGPTEELQRAQKPKE